MIGPCHNIDGQAWTWGWYWCHLKLIPKGYYILFFLLDQLHLYNVLELTVLLLDVFISGQDFALLCCNQVLQSLYLLGERVLMVCMQLSPWKLRFLDKSGFPFDFIYLFEELLILLLLRLLQSIVVGWTVWLALLPRLVHAFSFLQYLAYLPIYLLHLLLVEHHYLLRLLYLLLIGQQLLNLGALFPFLKLLALVLHHLIFLDGTWVPLSH